MRTLLLTLMISALLPVNDAVQESAELLRQAAMKAGCERPSVAMRWTGGLIEIEVRCLRWENP